MQTSVESSLKEREAEAAAIREEQLKLNLYVATRQILQDQQASTPFTTVTLKGMSLFFCLSKREQPKQRPFRTFPQA